MSASLHGRAHCFCWSHRLSQPKVNNASSRHSLGLHIRSVALVAGLSLIGMVALSFSPKRLSRAIPLLVSLAAGALLGTAFGHLLPESVERIGSGRKLSGSTARRLHDLFRVREVSLRLVQRIFRSNRRASTPILIITASLFRLRPSIPTSTDLRLAIGRWLPISCSERPFTA